VGLRCRRIKQQNKTKQAGQSIVELAYSLPFILIILLGVIEMGIVFSTYLSVVNAAREGAIFASMYPSLADATCGNVAPPNCIGANDGATYGGNSTTVWEEYYSRIANESFVAVGETLRSQQLVNSATFVVERPIAAGTSIGSGITSTVHYTITSFSSSMSFPFVGRMGLPSVYHIYYSVAMPIR